MTKESRSNLEAKLKELLEKHRAVESKEIMRVCDDIGTAIKYFPIDVITLLATTWYGNTHIKILLGTLDKFSTANIEALVERLEKTLDEETKQYKDYLKNKKEHSDLEKVLYEQGRRNTPHISDLNNRTETIINKWNYIRNNFLINSPISLLEIPRSTNSMRMSEAEVEDAVILNIDRLLGTRRRVLSEALCKVLKELYDYLRTDTLEATLYPINPQSSSFRPELTYEVLGEDIHVYAARELVLVSGLDVSNGAAINQLLRLNFTVSNPSNLTVCSSGVPDIVIRDVIANSSTTAIVFTVVEDKVVVPKGVLFAVLKYPGLVLSE